MDFIFFFPQYWLGILSFSCWKSGGAEDSTWSSTGTARPLSSSPSPAPTRLRLQAECSSFQSPSCSHWQGGAARAACRALRGTSGPNGYRSLGLGGRWLEQLAWQWLPELLYPLFNPGCWPFPLRSSSSALLHQVSCVSLPPPRGPLPAHVSYSAPENRPRRPSTPPREPEN